MDKKDKIQEITKEDAELLDLFIEKPALADFELPPLETTFYISTQSYSEGQRTFRRTGQVVLRDPAGRVRPKSEYTRLFHFGTRGYTKSDGIVAFRLSDVCLFNELGFRDPISITATSNNKPAIMTVDYSIVSNDENSYGNDIQLTVTSLDTNGVPLANVKFSLLGTLPYFYDVDVD